MREGRVNEKGRKYVGGGTWSGHAQWDFGGGGGNAGQNGKYGEFEGSAGGKESRGMWNETQAKQQRSKVIGEIGRRAKAHKE